MTAAIYIRVSTDAQAEEGYSIEAQKEQLTAYCVSKGIKNYSYYIDGGWSGSNIDRPEMKRLIEEIKQKKISHCVVYKLDRLSRSQRDTLYLIEDVFNLYGVAFISLTESLDTSTPMGRCMIGILSAFAQLERENIRMRTRMGMQERVKEGYWMGGGRIPFGYDYDKNTGILVPNPDAEKVKKIYDLYIKGYSAQSIANMLGLKYDRLALQILKRKSNYGVIEYNGVEYQGRHEPIISKETYEEAMSAMLRRTAAKVASSGHLLSGLVHCGTCGAKMRYQKWGKNDSKFVCYSQQKSKPYLVKDKNCRQERLWCGEIEDIVVKRIFSLKEACGQQDSGLEAPGLSPLVMLNGQKEEIERKIRRLYHLYAGSEDDLLLETIVEHKGKLEKINRQIALESKRKGIAENRNKAIAFISDLEGQWNYMEQKEKQAVIRILVQRIVITGNSVKLELAI